MSARENGSHDQRVDERDEGTLTRFVLLAKPRSGTSWLMERLAKHPEVGGYGEVLLPGVEGWSNWPRGAKDRPFFTSYLKERGISDSTVARNRHLFRYLDYLYEPRRGFRAIGFKLMYGHIARHPPAMFYLQSRQVRVLHLLRTNLLDLYLSRRAVVQRQWHHARAPEQREAVRVEVDTARLPSELRKIEAEQRIARRAIRALGLRVHELTYESLLAGDGSLYEALEFLRITETAGVDLSPIMLKLAPASQADGIANLGAVQATLHGTRFEKFLRP